MAKFILLSFGFLGWAFYEMSGGGDFQPASVRLAQAEATTSTQTQPAVIAAAAPAKAASVKTVNSEVNVKRVSYKVASNNTVQNDATPMVQQAVLRQSEPVSATKASSEPQWVAPTTPTIIPSPIASNNTAAFVQKASMNVGQGDIRTVAGDLVNVRGGPGTDHGVVTQLSRGEPVEIIEEANGWVHMRPLNGGQDGWMADFLLSNG